MKSLWLGIKFSLGYFTLVPVRFGENDDLSSPAVLRTMLLSLPAVGALLAAVSVALYLLLEPLGWFAAVAAAVFYMFLYGFIHTEAIIDVADAAYAAHSGKDPYQVIKEPTVGAMGVLYGAGFMILKTAALATLLSHHLFWEFAAISLISRLGLAWLVRVMTFRSVFVSQLRESFAWLHLLGATVLFGLLLFGGLGWAFAPLLGGGVAAVFLLAFLMQRSLGFLNGDTLGASLEGCELILIVWALALWS